jgi:uncharacterized protein (DUF2384 family)
MDRDKHPFVAAMQLATEFWTDEELSRWFTLGQPLLGDAAPLELLATGRSDELLRVLQQIDDGVYI